MKTKESLEERKEKIRTQLEENAEERIKIEKKIRYLPQEKLERWDLRKLVEERKALEAHEVYLTNLLNTIY